MSELLINCCMFTPKGCAGHLRLSRLGWRGGLGGCRSIPGKEPHPCQAPALPENPMHPSPAQSCRLGAQLLAASCAKPWANIWAGGSWRGWQDESERVRARSLGAKHPANFPLPIHQLATCSE